MSDGNADDDRSINLQRWNEVVDLHSASALYRVDDVISGRMVLSSIELRALGDISEAICLHPMCHIGTDTVLLARLCHRAIGFDYAQNAVAAARNLAARASLDNVSFLQGDVACIPLQSQAVDIVFANWGSLVWVFDLAGFFDEIRRVLRPRGRLVVIDQHPVALSFRRDASGAMAPTEGYLGAESRKVQRADYANRTARLTSTFVVESRHTFASIIQEVVNRFKLVEIQELGYLGWPAYEPMRRVEDRLWVLDEAPVPLSFALVAESI